MAKKTIKTAKKNTGVDVDKLAATVLAAQRDSKAIAQLSSRFKFRAPTGYRINDRVIEMRLDQGEHIVGVKMGLTSRAKMIQMGVSDMIWGWLTDAMLVEDGATVSFKDFIHPRAATMGSSPVNWIPRAYAEVATARQWTTTPVRRAVEPSPSVS